MMLYRMIILAFLFLPLIACNGSSSGSNAVIPPVVSVITVTGVSLTPDTVTLEIGEASTLSETVSPSDADDQSVTFSSSNDAVATVDSNGVVTAQGTGDATIMVTTTDGAFTANTVITVNVAAESPVTVTAVSVSPTSVALDIGQSAQLTFTITPSDATDSGVSWTSSDSAIATVDAAGMVSAIAAGAATVVITTNDGAFTAESNISVSPVSPSVTVSVADASSSEGDSGSNSLIFTISLSNDAPGNVDVDIMTTDGTATAGADYTAVASSTITIPAGSQSVDVEVVLVSDTDVEADETFTLTLSNPANASLGDQVSAVGTILNDDVQSVPPELLAADKPDVSPCPDQDILVDATELAEMQDALLTGAVLFLDVPYDAADVDNFGKKCGFNEFWDPARNVNEVSPASVGMTSVTLAQLLANGNAGICTQGSTPSNFANGFPAAGTYRGELKFSKGGSTWHMRMRGVISGSSAGNTFNSEGISIPGDIENTLEYKIDGNVVAHNNLFNSLVNAFSASANKVVFEVASSVGGASILGINVEMICASKN